MNEISQNTIKIIFDRALAINGDTLHAGENFLQHPAINGMNKFQKATDCRTISYTQVLSAETVQKIAFDTGAYTIKVSCVTSDNRALEHSTTATFK